MAIEAEPAWDSAADWRGEVARIFDTFQPRLFALALRMTWDREVARDLVQEGFLRLAQSGPRALRGVRAEAWLVRVVINLCRDDRRRARVRSVSHRMMDPPTASPGGEAALRAELREALGRLAPRRRAILLLHDLEGRTASEIAALVGSTEVTVRWHLHRARRSVRQLLGRAGYDDAS